MNAWNDVEARDLLRRLFEAAVASADPGEAVLRHLPPKPQGRCVVVGAGKASALMAAALDAAWPDVDVSGVVVTRHGQKRSAGRIEVLTAAHPVPDEQSVVAAHRMLEAVKGLGSADLVIALISGGGSSLMALPAGQMTLADKQAVNRVLLASGATIHEMNVVRRQLSAIKGGKLGEAVGPARLLTLIVSDVPGDDPAAVASGPTMPDPSTRAEACEIVARYGMVLPPAAQAVLAAPEHSACPASAQDRTGERQVKIIAAPMMALQAAAEAARAAGLTSIILGDALEAEARQMGLLLAGMARSAKRFGHPVAGPAVLLSGGEGTVTIGPEGAGRGGRNTECLLSMALALSAEQGIWALACDSDGIDGVQAAAGAIITPDTLARAHQAGLNARSLLQRHDSFSLFDRLGDLVITGPTGTNVNDIRAILVA
ncbi:MAG: glycerate kinase [Lautropia sp.]|nr:glycerate kinase [Lautropia sp.]